MAGAKMPGWAQCDHIAGSGSARFCSAISGRLQFRASPRGGSRDVDAHSRGVRYRLRSPNATSILSSALRQHDAEQIQRAIAGFISTESSIRLLFSALRPPQ